MQTMIATSATLATTAATLIALGLPQEQPSTGPTHSAYSTAPVAGHSHEGPMGEKLLYIEHLIRCTCSCNLDAHTCQFQMQCDVSPGYTQRIIEELAAGSTEDVILAGFVSDFGMSILMAPPMEGFNRVGYFMPSVAILITGLLIGLAVRRGTQVAPTRLAQDSGISPEEWETLQRELRAIEEDASDW